MKKDLISGQKNDVWNNFKRLLLWMNRGFEVKEVMDDYARFLVAIKDDNIRKTLCKVKVSNDFDSNFKVLSQVSVPTLAEVLKFQGWSP